MHLHKMHIYYVLIFSQFPICQRTYDLSALLLIRLSLMSGFRSLKACRLHHLNLSKELPLNLNPLGGGYRSRTDDPLRARQML